MIMQAERNRKSVSEIVRNAFLGRNMILQGCRKMRVHSFYIKNCRFPFFVSENRRCAENSRTDLFEAFIAIGAAGLAG